MGTIGAEAARKEKEEVDRAEQEAMFLEGLGPADQSTAAMLQGV